MHKILIFCFLIAPTSFAQANFLDKVGQVVDQVFIKERDSESAQLLTLSSKDYGFPSHWRTYHLTDTTFDTPVVVTESGKSSAPVILLIHGLGQNGLRDWLSIAPDLEKEYRVVLIDLPGFGASPRPKTKLSPTAYADLIHTVKTIFSDKPVYVVGHSMGAAVTLRYSHRYPEDIQQAALIDAAGILQRTAFVKHSATDRLPTNPDVIPNAFLSYAVGLQDFSNNLIEKMLRLPDPTTLLGKSELAWGATLQNFPNVNAALSLTEEDFSKAIFEQQRSIAILWGKLDKIAPLRTGQMLAATLPNSQLTIIDDAGHTPMSTHPKDVSQWIREVFSHIPHPPSMSSASNEVPQDLLCENQSGLTLEGRYRNITLKNCTAVLLQNSIVNQLTLEDSTIEIQDTVFEHTSTSITANKSVLMMTSSVINGSVNLDQARVDIAGSQFSNEKPFIVRGDSRLVMSVNKAGKQRYLHSDIRLKQTSY